MSELWNGGAKAYQKALREDYHAERDKLRAQLTSTKDELERQELEKQIVRLTEAYREKAQTTRRGLF